MSVVLQRSEAIIVLIAFGFSQVGRWNGLRLAGAIRTDTKSQSDAERSSRRARRGRGRPRPPRDVKAEPPTFNVPLPSAGAAYYSASLLMCDCARLMAAEDFAANVLRGW